MQDPRAASGFCLPPLLRAATAPERVADHPLLERGLAGTRILAPPPRPGAAVGVKQFGGCRLESGVALILHTHLLWGLCPAGTRNRCAFLRTLIFARVSRRVEKGLGGVLAWTKIISVNELCAPLYSPF